MPAPTISPLPTPPSRSSDPTNFSNEADAFVAALPEFVSDANAQASYLDGVASAVDADATAAAASAAAAEASANIAAAVADYQGAYNAGTTYQIGQSVSYNGNLYVASTVNTGITPVDGANWYLIANGDVTLNGVQTLTNKTIRQMTSVIGINTNAAASTIYILTASLTLTLPSAPTSGDWVAFVNRSATTTPVIGRNGSNIMSLAEDMTLNNVNASGTLVYADATRGWVLVD